MQHLASMQLYLDASPGGRMPNPVIASYVSSTSLQVATVAVRPNYVFITSSRKM